MTRPCHAHTTGPRTFFRSTTNTRCRNADDTRSFTIQTSAVACFRYCEMMRGCGQCDYFSWSFANKNCIFSTALRTACEPEPYDGFDMYQGQGQCLGAGQEARTGMGRARTHIGGCGPPALCGATTTAQPPTANRANRQPPQPPTASNCSIPFLWSCVLPMS